MCHVFFYLKNAIAVFVGLCDDDDNAIIEEDTYKNTMIHIFFVVWRMSGGVGEVIYVFYISTHDRGE